LPVLQHAFLTTVRGWPDAYELNADTSFESLADQARASAVEVLAHAAGNVD